MLNPDLEGKDAPKIFQNFSKIYVHRQSDDGIEILQICCKVFLYDFSNNGYILPGNKFFLRIIEGDAAKQVLCEECSQPATCICKSCDDCSFCEGCFVQVSRSIRHMARPNL